MINIAKAEADSAAWGISLRDYMELHVQMFAKIDVFDAPVFEREPDEQWRGQVADALIHNKLLSKANRFMECCRYAHTYECEGSEKHKLFSPVYCDLRYCPRCGPRQYARLMEKYEPILKAVSAHKKPGFRLRRITLTTRNTGELTTAQIKKFNRDVKNTLKLLWRSVSGWGAIWCDEVGFENTNLHAHVLAYGPYISQDELAKTWQRVSGNQVVDIRDASRSGTKALLYMLKYVSKPPANDPEFIGLLETAFHGVRRVHTVGVFYNFTGDDPDHEHSEWSKCPHCGADISKIPGSTRIESAILSGKTYVGTRNTPRRKQWLN
jgi:replication protein